MAAKKGNRVKVVLACTECKQRNYDTFKNSKTTTERLERNKYSKMALQAKAKKPNVFKRLGNFFVKSWSELKKVAWPSFQTVLKNTGIVLLVVLFFALLLFGVDSLFAWLISLTSK